MNFHLTVLLLKDLIYKSQLFYQWVNSNLELTQTGKNIYISHHIPNGRGPGINGIINEQYKYGNSDNLIEIVHTVISIIF